jgi:hypothetical protein
MSDFPTLLTIRKKPVEARAMIWDGTAVGSTAILDWIAECGGDANYRCNDDECTERPEDHHISIRTLEGRHRIDAGYWVVQGVAGEFYGCRPDIAEATYDIITNSSPDDA